MSHELSSDVLEQQFGPTIVEVLGQDDKSRVICTKEPVSNSVLEISRVNFKPVGVGAFPAVHELVVAGQSMGKAFRSADVEFERVEHSAQRTSLPEGFHKWFGSDQSATVVEVSVLVGQEQLPYAEILEVYNPSVEWPESGTAGPGQTNALDALNQFLLDKQLVG